MPKKRVTIKDVATEAGVSHPVVSVVLTGRKSSIRYSEATERRVLEAAAHLDYQPDILARSFKEKKSYLIGVLGFDINSPLFSEMLRGMQDVLFPANYAPMLLTHHTGEEEKANFERCLKRQVDGLVVNCYVEKPGERFLEEYTKLAQQGLPIVELLGVALDTVPTVAPDYIQVGRNAARHLIDKGHRNIAMLTHCRYDVFKQNPARCWDAWYMYQGYATELAKAGLDEIVITHDLPDPPDMTIVEWAEGTAASMDQLLDPEKGITAAVCFIDYQAVTLAKELKKRGINVPEDFSVVGYRNLPICDYDTPAITSQDFDSYQLGARAADMILAGMAGESVTDSFIPPQLIERHSTAPVPGVSCPEHTEEP